jgi:hypothetical protein
MMHPFFTYQMALQRVSSLHQEAASRRRAHEARSYRRARAASLHPPQPVRTAIQLRLSACRDELERLAALSDRRVRDGDWLVADLDGEPVAAVSIEDGTTLYDPFRPTSQVVSLLELRRKQVLATAY